MFNEKRFLLVVQIVTWFISRLDTLQAYPKVDMAKRLCHAVES